jgi:hypothetical protein
MITADETFIQKAQLLGSLLHFTQVFYKIRTGRDFTVDRPVGREPHQITICKAFTNVFNLKCPRLIINIEPGSGKSELCIHFVAWALAHYPDCNFIYTSISHSRALMILKQQRAVISAPAALNRRLWAQMQDYR